MCAGEQGCENRQKREQWLRPICWPSDLILVIWWNLSWWGRGFCTVWVRLMNVHKAYPCMPFLVLRASGKGASGCLWDSRYRKIKIWSHVHSPKMPGLHCTQTPGSTASGAPVPMMQTCRARLRQTDLSKLSQKTPEGKMPYGTFTICSPL